MTKPKNQNLDELQKSVTENQKISTKGEQDESLAWAVYWEVKDKVKEKKEQTKQTKNLPISSEQWQDWKSQLGKSFLDLWTIAKQTFAPVGRFFSKKYEKLSPKKKARIDYQKQWIKDSAQKGSSKTKKWFWTMMDRLQAKGAYWPTKWQSPNQDFLDRVRFWAIKVQKPKTDYKAKIQKISDKNKNLWKSKK